MRHLRREQILANDIWGLRYDKLFAPDGQTSVWKCGTMAEIIAKHDVPGLRDAQSQGSSIYGFSEGSEGGSFRQHCDR